MLRKPIFLIFVFFYTVIASYSQDFGLTEEELAAFRVTVYTQEEKIPLDGLLTLEGLPFDSTALQGRYVLLNMGATWCPYCNREKPTIERLFSEYFRNDNFTILVIYLNEKVETVKTYMERGDYHFPAVVDTTSRLYDEYAPQIPATYLTDPEGKIIARINGYKEWDSDTAIRLIGNIISNVYNE